ncbi:ribonuclease T2 family protein [Pararhizobium sp.]|uniref:ribonuclease T2 family protein n=1 Tax=Pararhizobium sp. TaxID=1977563 RepID=UPI002D803068|nr:ribonuclease [Pararhizobium sp.]
MSRALLSGALLLLAGCGEQKSAESGEAEPKVQTPQKQAASVPIGKGFDFYVLSLSWSPTWCGNNDGDGSSQQCAAGKNHGFIVHGLWPQNQRGFPEFCRSRDPDRVPEALGRALFDLIPSMGLIGHQWRKHGSCSGLGQKDYFAVLRAARQRIRIPAGFEQVRAERRLTSAEIERTIIASNPGLKPTGISVSCDGVDLQDVRICLTKDLAFTGCPEVERKACRRNDITLPPAR